MFDSKRLAAGLVATTATFAISLGTAGAQTTGGPTAPDGTNFNNQTTVCHHNAAPDGAVTVVNRNRTISNGSGDDVFCGTPE
jgi:hypothetical protein